MVWNGYFDRKSSNAACDPFGFDTMCRSIHLLEPSATINIFEQGGEAYTADIIINRIVVINNSSLALMVGEFPEISLTISIPGSMRSAPNDGVVSKAASTICERIQTFDPSA